jgi:multiple sugar transport system ATP-binding protein
MAAVTLKGVTKTFGSRRDLTVAVDGLTLGVADRELVVLLGPSGCGKTTTLRLVAGLETASEGTIEIGGRVVDRISPKDRDVALVFQNYALYPHMTVAGNLAFGLKMRRVPKSSIRERVAETAAMLGIEDLLERKPLALSGGQQQRVAFGRAIIRRPNVYLFDEPLANLDAPLRAQMRLELKRMQRELGMTALYVTHDQHEAMCLADRIVVMKDGRVQQEGTPQEVFDAPSNRFVGGFLGTPPMNFLDGRIVEADGAVVCEVDGRRFGLPDVVSRRVGHRTGDRVTLGIRPERVDLTADEPAGVGSLPMCVSMLEPTGDRLDVHCRFGTEGRLVARVVSPARWSVGSQVWASFDAECVTLFEADECGMSVTANGHGVASDAT